MNRHASMNRIYRLVWSQVRNAWVPMAENAKGRGKAGRAKSASRGHAAAAALSLVLTPLAHASPTGGQVVAGAGSISRSGTTTTIQQSSANLSINWQGFNVAPQETVNFLQPSASSIAVNRIFSSNGSQILGHLDANGQVYLINPNGILFGKGARVNVGGLVASTLDLNDASFVGSAKSFSGSAVGGVVNQGTISAANGGYVALLGAQVGNQGVISAQLGTVALAAGSAVTLTFNGNSLVHLQVDRSVLKSVAQNGGLLQADGGQVLMTAGAKDALLVSVVNNTGVIEARTVENHGGTITLLGSMTAGTVQVGGTLDASAVSGGHGGQIETSGAHVEVADDAKVTTASSRGLYGSWLIDPQDFKVAASGGDITGATLSTELASTAVTLQSSSGGHAGSGNVDVNDKVSWSANTALTLTASNNVDVNTTLTATGATAGLIIKPNTANGSESASGKGVFNLAGGAAINLPNVSPTSTTALVINGTPYTVLNQLGAAGSTTGTDLQGVNGNLSGHYALGSHIDATATSTWNSGAGFAPIGNASTPFSGTFNGLGHTIGNLTINRPTTDNVGLFGQIGSAATVRNVGLVGGSVSGNFGVGALVGTNYGGTVSNSHATGSVSGAYDVGGLVGYNFAGSSSAAGFEYVRGTLIGDYATGHVSGSGSVGGLVGYNQGTVSYSHATGSVQGADYVGGLVGFIQGDYQEIGAVSTSYATGNVKGVNNVGGLVGGNGGGYGGSIFNSHATGSVTGDKNVGGLLGYNGGGQFMYGGSTFGNVGSVSSSYATGSVSGSAQNVGGLVGFNQALISSSSATGKVSGTSEVGGLVGYNGGWNGTYRTKGVAGGVSNSYATGSVSGSGNDIGGLVGFNGGGNGSYGEVGVVSNSYATGGVHGASNIGGLVGYNSYGTSVSNSYATGAVNGSGAVGGLVGFNSGVGGNYGTVGTVATSYAKGSVSGTSDVGGLVGSNGGTLSDSFWNVDTSGQSSSAGGTGLTTAQMQTAANFTGFNFTSTPGGAANRAASNAWVMVDTDGTLNNAGRAAGSTFPMLASEYSTTITNAHQLQLMAMNTAASYALGRNIEASGTATGTDVWGSSGFAPIRFSGTFDGRGRTIFNLTLTTAPVSNGPIANGGLFSTSSGVIRSVGLVGGTVSGDFAVGALVGSNYGTIINSHATTDVGGRYYVGGLVGVNSGTVSGSYSTGRVLGSGYVGGLVGQNEGTISRSYATGSATGFDKYVGGLVGYNNGKVSNSHATAGVSGSSYVGGLVGYDTGLAKVGNSYATGSVSGFNYVGGLVGLNYAGPISNSYATGSVSGSNQFVGGLVGLNYGGLVSNSYATGNVSGSSYVGGLVGLNRGQFGSVVGTLANTYATGSVTGSSHVGGLVGANYAAVIDSFWNVTTSGQSSSAGGTGLTTTQMQTAANFTGFNFTTTPGGAANRASGNAWVMVDTDGTLNNAGGAVGATFPMLASEYSTTITNAHQLQLMAMNTAVRYNLGQNIDASATRTGTDVWSSLGFAPIGNSVTPFTGMFDGWKHTISNLTINAPDETGVGLFGATGSSAEIRNVGLIGGSVTGAGYVGGLVGTNAGTIRSSYATGSVSGSYGGHVGGLAGINTGSISHSYATSDVAATANSGSFGYGYVGGLVGENFGTISNSHATGGVRGSSYVGGLVGYNGGAIRNSYATGNVDAVSNGLDFSFGALGGLVGANTGLISKSHATGSVGGASYSQFNSVSIGGLAGSNTGTGTISDSYATGDVSSAYGDVGGLVGTNSGTIRNSFATGSVSGSGYGGGLLGFGFGTVKNSFWDLNTSGQTTSAGGIGMTTAQMKTQANFTSATVANGNVNPGWDFVHTWVMTDGLTYPLLKP